MVYQDRYEISLLINGEEYQEMASEFSFTLMDSIWNYYPEGKIMFRDYGGFLQEFFALANGTRYDITFGTGAELLTCPFTVLRNGLNENTIQNSLGGLVQADLIHESYYNQEKLSASYTTPLHSIVSNLASQYPYTSVNVDSTKNKGTWYQPLVSNMFFIKHILLPNAYSTDSDETPFYCYADLKNNFYFKNYKKLFYEAKPVSDIFSYSDTQDSNATNVVKSINRLQTSLTDIRKLYKRQIHSFDKDGNFITEEDTLLDYPSGLNKIIPINAQDTLNLLTDSLELYSDSEDTDKQRFYNNLGLKLNTIRPLLHIDKLILVMPLNTKMTAGKKINLLYASGGDETKEESSNQYSGECLIEKSFHNWDGNVGSTNIVVSRPSINVPDSYYLKPDLIQS